MNLTIQQKIVLAVKESRQDYYQKNKEKILAYQKEYRTKNKERLKLKRLEKTKRKVSFSKNVKENGLIWLQSISLEVAFMRLLLGRTQHF